MRLSIIVPVYNCAPYLQACLESIAVAIDKVERLKGCKIEKSGGGERWGVEVICVDDGSTDGSAEILDEFQRETTAKILGAEWRVVHQKNAGEGGARNRGLEESTGEWFGFLDADDLYAPQMLDAVVRGIESDPEADIVSVKRQNFNDGEAVPAGGDGTGLLQRVDLSRTFGGPLIGPGLMSGFYRRKRFGDIRFGALRIGADRVYGAACHARCDRAVLADVCGYLYRQRRESVSNSGMSVEKIRDAAEYVWRYLEIVHQSGKTLPNDFWGPLTTQLVVDIPHLILAASGSDKAGLWKFWREAVLSLSAKGMLARRAAPVSLLLRCIPAQVVARLVCEPLSRIKTAGVHR